MKSYLGSLVLVLGVPLNLFSQKIKDSPPHPLEVVVEDTLSPHPCVYAQSTKTRQTVFPFNQADSIKIFSYVSYMESRNPKRVVAAKIVTDEIKEQVILSESQTERLFSIFYDSQKGRFWSDAFCWNPRHCIVFYQGKNELAFLEICFACSKIYHPPNVDFGDLCEDKFTQWRSFFKQMGIQYKIEANEH